MKGIDGSEERLFSFFFTSIDDTICEVRAPMTTPPDPSLSSGMWLLEWNKREAEGRKGRMGLMLIFASSSISRAVIFIPKYRGGKWSHHRGYQHLEFLLHLMPWQGCVFSCSFSKDHQPTSIIWSVFFSVLAPSQMNEEVNVFSLVTPVSVRYKTPFITFFPEKNFYPQYCCGYWSLNSKPELHTRFPFLTSFFAPLQGFVSSESPWLGWTVTLRAVYHGGATLPCSY